MNVIKQIGLFFIVAIVLVATNGYTFYHHYCNHTDYDQKSIFASLIVCDHQEDLKCCSSFHHEEISSCCDSKHDDISHVRDHFCEDGSDCCTTEATFFKIDIFEFEKIQKPSFKFVANYVVELISCEEFISHSTKFEIRNINDLPPPKFGKALLLKLHQIKIDTPLS